MGNLDGRIAACTSGQPVASIGWKHYYTNKYIEMFNSRGKDGGQFYGLKKNFPEIEQAMKREFFDLPVETAVLLLECEGFDGKWAKNKLTAMDNGQVLAHLFEPARGKFGSHLDKTSTGVCLWNFGNTAEFTVCFKKVCDRADPSEHATMRARDIPQPKTTCPDCNVIRFESGDCLVFNGDPNAGCYHGVANVSRDSVLEASAVPDWLRGKRLSIQWRGRLSSQIDRVTPNDPEYNDIMESSNKRRRSEF